MTDELISELVAAAGEMGETLGPMSSTAAGTLMSALGCQTDMAVRLGGCLQMTQPRRCIAHTEATPYAELDGAIGGRG